MATATILVLMGCCTLIVICLAVTAAYWAGQVSGERHVMQQYDADGWLNLTPFAPRERRGGAKQEL